MNLFLLGVGMSIALYGGSIVFSPRAAAYINKISLDKYWLSPEMAECSVTYVDGACALGLGVALMAVAFAG